MTSILECAPAPDLTVMYGPLPEHVIDLRLLAVMPERGSKSARTRNLT